jgi:hypothetical protein
MPGAVPGTSGIASASPALPLGINIQPVKVTGLNAISIEICNQSAAAYDPGSLTFSVVLTGSQYR